MNTKSVLTVCIHCHLVRIVYDGDIFELLKFLCMHGSDIGDLQTAYNDILFCVK